MFDIYFCTKKINDLKKKLIEYRNQYNWVRNEVNNLELNKEIPTRNKRARIDQVSVDKSLNYKRLFFEIIGTIIVKIEEWFSEIHNLKFMALLDFDKFPIYNDDFPQDSFSSLKQS